MSDEDTLNAERVTLNASGEPSSISRRRALQVLGTMPVAVALGQRLQVTPPAVASSVQHPAFSANAPRFFNEHEWQTVRVLTDYIIPKDDRSGSATDAKVPEYIDYLLAEKDASLATQTAMRGGLAWLDTESHKRFSKTFLAATDAQRREILDDIAYPEKAKPEMRYGVSFFNRMRDMTASGFFSSSIGWKDVQYIGNVFNPGYDGCPPAALDKLGVSYDVMNTRIAPDQK